MKFERFNNRIWLSSPTMHGEELEYMKEANRTNQMSEWGPDLDMIENQVSKMLGCSYAVALSSCTAAFHLSVRLAGEALYGIPETGHGSLSGHHVFCSDMTFSASVNPVIYEDGIPVFIDSERDTWNLDPVALQKAFEIYPDVRLIVAAHLYGTPGKIDEIRRIADAHGALVVEDAAEALGALYKGKKVGSFGDYGCISFNGNKIITGSSGGIFLTNSLEDAKRVRQWSGQLKDNTFRYSSEDTEYNYRMSNVIASVIRGQFPHLEEHIAQKKAIYERYREGLQGLPVTMNPIDFETSQPNYWLSCLLIDKEAMCRQVRGDHQSLYVSEAGKTCPEEIRLTLWKYNVESRPIWKPMHMQPFYCNNPFITACGCGRSQTVFSDSDDILNVDADIFERGLCLPSDNKMTVQQQNIIIEMIRSCFG